MSVGRVERYNRLFLLGLLVISLLGAFFPSLKPAHAHIDTSIPNPFTEQNWQVSWTDSDTSMTVVNNVNFKGAADPYNVLITKAKVPSIYVDYPSSAPEDIRDVVGHDALEHLHKFPWQGGVVLEADYYYGCLPEDWPIYGCYRYVQQWLFKPDGTFFPWIEAHGPGLKPGWGGPSYGLPDYYVRWMFDTGVYGRYDDGFAHYESSGWVKPSVEDKKLAASPYDGFFDWKIFHYPEGTSSAERLAIDPHAPDNPTMYYNRYYSNQEVVPLCTATITTNCDKPGQHIFGSPTVWDNNESIQDTIVGSPDYDNVQWYVTNHDATSCGNGDLAPPCIPGGNWQAINIP